MEAFLHGLLPKILPSHLRYDIHTFQGKAKRLRELENRLLAYASFRPMTSRVVVLVDRDADDCWSLKEKLESAAQKAEVPTRTQMRGTQQGAD